MALIQFAFPALSPESNQIKIAWYNRAGISRIPHFCFFSMSRISGLNSLKPVKTSIWCDRTYRPGPPRDLIFQNAYKAMAMGADRNVVKKASALGGLPMGCVREILLVVMIQRYRSTRE